LEATQSNAEAGELAQFCRKCGQKKGDLEIFCANCMSPLVRPFKSILIGEILLSLAVSVAFAAAHDLLPKS